MSRLWHLSCRTIERLHDGLLRHVPVDGAVRAEANCDSVRDITCSLGLTLPRYAVAVQLAELSEVIVSERYSLPADIYSFGVILWEICEASAPFADLAPGRVPIAVVQEKMRPRLSPSTPQVR